MSQPLEIETRATRLPRAPLQRRDTVCIVPWLRSGGRKVTRAHLRMSREPAFCAALASSLSAVERELRKATGVQFGLEAHVFKLVTPMELMERIATWAVIALPISGAKAVLEINDGASAHLFRHLGLGCVWPAERLSKAEDSTLTQLLLTALRALAEFPVWKSGFAPRLLALCRDRKQAMAALTTGELHVDVGVRLVVAGSPWCLTLYVPARAIEVAMLKAPVRRRALHVPSAIAKAEIPAQVVAGRGSLSLRQLSRLAPGDTVEIAGLGWHAGKLVGAARLRTAAFEAHGALFPRGLELSRFNTTVSPQEPQMSDDLSQSLLPIEVEVELTRFSLPLSELATLRPGAVVPLRQHDSDPVTLRVGGRPIARAELVDIDGEVGARILELLEREEAP
jgi:type III secretion protein Q